MRKDLNGSSHAMAFQPSLNALKVPAGALPLQRQVARPLRMALLSARDSGGGAFFVSSKAKGLGNMICWSTWEEWI